MAPAAPTPAIIPSDGDALCSAFDWERSFSVAVMIETPDCSGVSTNEKQESFVGLFRARRYLQPALHRWSRQPALEPRFDVRKIVEPDDVARAVEADQIVDRAQHRNVRDRKLIAGEPCPPVEMTIHHAEQPLGLVDVAVAGACPPSPCPRTSRRTRLGRTSARRRPSGTSATGSRASVRRDRRAAACR